MSKQSLGKTLLKNVIRHTDSHNKIQEEKEMWKMRGWEVKMSHHKHLSDTQSVRGRMHCDRVPDQPRGLSQSRERVSEHDDREARYWTRKLYEFESNDPDRWGHSGFKELYPEEFKSDGEKSSASKKKKKKSKSDTDASLSKHKKSSRKKKKKKKKKEEEEKRKRAECSSSSDDSSAEEQKRKRTKSRHKNKKSAKSRARDEDSSSEDSNDKEERERRTHSRKRRKQDSHKNSDSGPDSKKKRKNWKAAGEESSNDTSGD